MAAYHILVRLGLRSITWRDLNSKTEFRNFVEQTEKELWQLFKSIDRDRNGQLDKGELSAAFDKAGIMLPPAKLDQFFSEVDSNHDGVISFDEWRYMDRSKISEPSLTDA